MTTTRRLGTRVAMTRTGSLGAGAVVTRTRWLGVVVAVTVVVAVGSTGCAVIPVTGPHSVADAGGGDPLSKPFQRMIAIRPQKGWSPAQLIRGLQAAMAAYPDDPKILPSYLTPNALAKWDPSGPVNVIEDGFEVLPPGPRDGSDAVLKVSLKARWVAKINEDDSYVPTIGDWDGGAFELVKDAEDNYRVNDLPRGLLLTASDVARAYRATNLYYLSRNPQDPRLVADRVWLRLKPTESFAQTILERLIEPPTSALQGGAVTTSFPPGTQVKSITHGDDRVVVNLSGGLDPVRDESLLAQIRYSLNRNEVAKGRTIEVQVDGEVYGLDQPNSDERWLDDSSDTAYYVNRGAVHYLGKDGPAGTVQGPAGEPREGYSGFALSREGDGLIAARTSTGISVAGLTQEGRWQEVIRGADLTAPTWHRDGSLWTYDRQNAALLRYDPAGGGGAQRVTFPLKGLDVTRFRIARDGVRVAVTTGKNTVQIGAFIEGAGGTQPGNFHMLTTTEIGEKILDLAWEDADHLLVLIENKAGQILNQVNVGDGETVGVPLKEALGSLAAQGDRVLAATDDGAKVVELNQDQKTWTAKIESDGGAPLFPLG
ncbi:LpqB family beta-propeller domain-containing protein [Nonomuraea jiangxiensis]|uniref:Sporulation and spore germination n=1 Tax=Nonomuraea jiangxiensis TaxID=633440 RepID=A0A1G8F2R0_9ACTN|nr:LpqB family beta-propeller domain-containing protein [Nonomuraea jiangxiensis]SDH76392.1 Sporulation and spore germination [Nonomuraea jiangxiensis]